MSTTHRVQLRRYGRSLGIEIPKSVLRTLGLSAGDLVHLSVEGDSFFVSPDLDFDEVQETPELLKLLAEVQRSTNKAIGYSRETLGALPPARDVEPVDEEAIRARAEAALSLGAVRRVQQHFGIAIINRNSGTEPASD